MRKSVLGFILVFAVPLVFSAIPSLALEPAYFVLGDSTPSATVTKPPYPPTNAALYSATGLASPGARLEIRKDEYERRRLELKAKIETIKDQRKKTIINNLSEKMALVNQRRTTFWKNVLTKLSQILARAKTKTSELKAAGKDTSAVDAAIVSADTAIKNAQAAIDAQAGKSYLFNFTTEAALKTNIGQAISGEQADLQSVKKSVDEAHKAVSYVIRLLKQLIGMGVPPLATPSGGAK